MTPERTEDVFAALRDPATEAATNSRRAGDGTIDRIVKELRTTINTVRRQLVKLHKDGRAHIIGWTEGNPRSPIWASGPGEHEPKPPKKSAEAAAQQQRERRQAEKARREQDPDYAPPTPARAKAQIDQFIGQVRKGPPLGVFAALYGYREAA